MILSIASLRCLEMYTKQEITADILISASSRSRRTALVTKASQWIWMSLFGFSWYTSLAYLSRGSKAGKADVSNICLWEEGGEIRFYRELCRVGASPRLRDYEAQQGTSLRCTGDHYHSWHGRNRHQQGNLTCCTCADSWAADRKGFNQAYGCLSEIHTS